MNAEAGDAWAEHLAMLEDVRRDKRRRFEESAQVVTVICKACRRLLLDVRKHPDGLIGVRFAGDDAQHEVRRDYPAELLFMWSSSPIMGEVTCSCQRDGRMAPIRESRIREAIREAERTEKVTVIRAVQRGKR